MPNGTVQTNSFATLITFSLKPNVGVWEKELTPLGYDMGGPIDLVTGRNSRFRTKGGKKLIDVTDVMVTVAYDEQNLSDIQGMMGKNQQITVTFPDGAPEVFYGFIDKWKPNRMSNTAEDQPTAEMTVCVTSMSLASTPAETGPSMGTTTSTTTTT